MFVTYDGSGKPEGVKLYVDGVAAETEVENNKESQAAFGRMPCSRSPNAVGSHFDGVGLQDLRIYSRTLAPAK